MAGAAARRRRRIIAKMAGVFFNFGAFKILDTDCADYTDCTD